VSVAYERDLVFPGGTLDIEDASRTKTLVRFIHPMPVLAEYRETDMIALF
jgi:hypothetical protein